MPYLGEIRITSFNFAPRGWAFCNGQLLPINQNQGLFSLLGTQFGGNGQTNFALPDIRGRVAESPQDGIFGTKSGANAHTLTLGELPGHTHSIVRNNTVKTTMPAALTAGNTAPENGYFATNAAKTKRFSNRHDASMAPADVTMTSIGGNQPHENRQPYIALSYIICLVGEFPNDQNLSTEYPFVAEVRMFAFNFAPAGHAQCQGQLLPLSQNTALFSLLGTTYGGNGSSNFALPDLRDKLVMHPGQGPSLTYHDLGEMGGSAGVTLLNNEIPSHNHTMTASVKTGDPAQLTANAVDAYPATVAGTNLYSNTADGINMAALNIDADATQVTGGDLPHNNKMPSLTVNFCIALQGIFPQRW